MEFVIFDTETTGLLQPSNSLLSMQPKIIEFYGVRLNTDFEIINEVNELINPCEPVSKEITRITGITNSMLEGKPVFLDVAPKIAALFHESNLAIAHNIAFDNGMLKAEYGRLGIDTPKAKYDLCTVEATMYMMGFRLSLTRLHQTLFKKAFKAHRAKDDVHALVRCVHHLSEKGRIDFGNYK